MNGLKLSFKNLFRNRLRIIMTLSGMAVALIAFVAIRTVSTAWNSASEHAAKDRIGTRHKVTFIQSMPKRYVEDIKNVPGVKQLTYFSWFGGKNPAAEKDFFGMMATDPKTFFDVYDEVEVTPAERESWTSNRRGIIVGEVIAKKFGWTVGQKLVLTSTIFPGNWEFEVSGIYKALRRSMDRSSVFFHWDYFNDSLAAQQRDQVGWIVTRIENPKDAASLSKRIDDMFAERDVQTLSMSEKAMQQSFLGMFSEILKVLDIVSVAIMIIMMLILGNTIAMNIRERTSEIGMMRAIGFQPKNIATYILFESLMAGLLGGLLGCLLAFPLVELGLGRFLEENVAMYFPFFRIASSTYLLAIGASVLLAVVAGLIPAINASRVKVVDAVRRVG